MRGCLVAIAALLIVTVALAGAACGESDGGAMREKGSMRIVLNESGIGSSGGAIWVDVTVHNLGLTSLSNFKTYLGFGLLDAVRAREAAFDEYTLNKYLFDATYDKYLYETQESVCEGETILSGEQSRGKVQVWDVVKMGTFAWGDTPYLIVSAEDEQGQTYSAGFTIPQDDNKIEWSLR